MSQRHGNYNGFVKSRVAPKVARFKDRRPFLVTLCKKVIQKDGFLETMTIENGTKNRSFYKSSALGPSKNGSGERLKKNMKIDEKTIG